MSGTRSFAVRLVLVPVLLLPGMLAFRGIEFPEGPLVGWALGLVLTAAAWVAAARRPISDIGIHFSGALPGIAGGILLGLALLLVPAQAGRLLGGADSGVGRIDDPDRFALSALALLLGAFAEEALFRGYLLGTLEERWAPRRSLVFATLLFGMGHSFNPHAAPLGLFTVLAAAWALGVVYQHTRSLWAPAGLHFAWNAGIVLGLGAPLSGHDLAPGGALMPTEFAGGFGGGDWGPEAGPAWTAAWLLVAVAVTAWLPPRRPMDADERAWRELARER